MSVVKGKQKPGKLRVLYWSRNLCKYTLTVTKSEKFFPKSTRWQYTYKIVEWIEDAHTDILDANSTRCITWNDYLHRRECQINAYGKLEKAAGLLDIVKELGRINGRKAQVFAKLIVNTQDTLTKWANSDYERYAKQFGKGQYDTRQK